MDDFRERVQVIFREVFDDPRLELRDEMTAADVDGWDSMAHINLIIALERNLKIKFATAEVSKMKQSGQNGGSLLQLIADKAVAAGKAGPA